MTTTYLLDTGAWVGLLDRNDPFHDWAQRVFEEIAGPFLTCDAVVTECSHFVNGAPQVLQAIERGLVRPSFDTAGEITRLLQIQRQFADRAPDFADLCLIRMSEIHPRCRVITVDAADFRVYRRNGRQMIPILCPPERATSQM